MKYSLFSLWYSDHNYFLFSPSSAFKVQQAAHLSVTCFCFFEILRFVFPDKKEDERVVLYKAFMLRHLHVLIFFIQPFVQFSYFYRCLVTLSLSYFCITWCTFWTYSTHCDITFAERGVQGQNYHHSNSRGRYGARS